MKLQNKSQKSIKMKQILVTIAAVVLVGCTMTRPIPQKGNQSSKTLENLNDSLKNQINKEIDSMVKEWDKSAANKDAKRLSELYAKNADIIHYDNVHHVGRKSIQQHFEKQFINDSNLKKVFSDHQRFFVTPEIVIETAKSHITGSKITPRPPTRGRYTATYIKSRGRWLVLYERAWWTWPFKYD